MNAFIALDVGGTSIKASAITPCGALLTPGVTHYPSLAKEDKETLLNHFTHIILKQIERLPMDVNIVGIGLAFPGPFDYTNGISLMQDINKYDSLYGVSIGIEILNRLQSFKSFTSVSGPDCTIKFENDASLFALGETVLNPGLMHGKALCLCIGTGLGSAFLEDGKLITTRSDVPARGWVYNTPFLGSIIDDYISARGILSLHQTLHGSIPQDVKTIAQLAASGDLACLETFKCFGIRFADAIHTFLQNFRPDTLVIGGQIAKSFPLFKDSFISELQEDHTSIQICLSVDSSFSTLVGVNRLFEQQ